MKSTPFFKNQVLDYQALAALWPQKPRLRLAWASIAGPSVRKNLSSPYHFPQHPHNCCRWHTAVESAPSARSGRNAWLRWFSDIDGRNPPSPVHPCLSKCRSCRPRRFSLSLKSTGFSWKSQYLFIPTTPRHPCRRRANG